MNILRCKSLVDMRVHYYLLFYQQVSAMTFVNRLEEHASGNLEAVTVRTFGMKNIDAARDLKDKALPIEVITYVSITHKI